MRPALRRVQRLLTLVPWLRARPGVAFDVVTRELGISRAQLAADLDQLLLCGVPPYYPHDYLLVDVEGERITLAFAEHLARPVRFSCEEALALLALLATLPQELAARAPAAAAGLQAKLRGLLPAAVEALDGRVEGPRLEPALAELSATLAAAVASHHVLHLGYYTAGRDASTDRAVCPLALRAFDGVLYLIAECRLRGGRRSFRVDRIRAATPTGEQFTPPANLDLADWRPHQAEAAGGGAEVRLVFAPELARWARERWAAAACENLPDGGLRVRLYPPRADWLLRHLLPLGEDVTIEAPASLRGEMRALIDRLRAGSAEY